MNATSPDQLQEFESDNYNLNGKFLAHSIKNDEKVFITCMCGARQSKYIKSIRSYGGGSLPIFGLKGWRIHAGSGESIPIHDYVAVALGYFVLTNKNVHLCAKDGKPIKIPYNKIEGFRLYDDSIEIFHGVDKPTLFQLKKRDPIDIEVIGHIIDLHTR